MTTEEFKDRLLPYSRKLYPMMKRILGGEEETRDALQELMLKLWEKRENLLNCNNPDGYVIAAARNHCFDVKKKARQQLVSISGDTPVQIAASIPDPDAGEKLEHVHRIIRNFPETYREVLEMREIDGLSYEEIQMLTGHGIPYIRVLLSRSRVKLKDELEKIYTYERGTCRNA